jgi:prophage antirepressor-like protein
MNEQLVLFEGQEEIKVKTDQGETLINLSNSAKICGLVKKDNARGTERIRWTGNGGISDKLNKIRENLVNSTSATNSAQKDYDKYIEEIDYIIDEIENGDDRNSIFMSSWMSKRLAMNCNSEKAENYKNWLATLDEQYSKGEFKINSQQLTNLVSNTMNNILPTMIESITKQFNPILAESRKQVEESRKQVEDMSKKLGLRNRNTQIIGKKLIHKENEFYGKRIYGNYLEHRLNKDKIFNKFNVLSLDDIPLSKFDEVIEYVERMQLTPKEVVEKYQRKSSWS